MRVPIASGARFITPHLVRQGCDVRVSDNGRTGQLDRLLGMPEASSVILLRGDGPCPWAGLARRTERVDGGALG